ncbi:MAG: radical SAM protein [Promethearchaeota archaeon]
MSIEKIRVSIGSASVLGLRSTIKLKDVPTTCYLMTFKEGHCTANCGFCPQASSSKSSMEMLSRVTWPTFKFKDFLTKLKQLPSSKKFRRVCIQTLNYSGNFEDLKEIITQIKLNINVPISVAIPPMSRDKLIELKLMGVQRVGIALDGTTPEVFKKIKGSGVDGPYDWDHHYNKLIEATEIFPNGFVSTHLIIGLGETEKEVIERIEELTNLKILISLFAFTPIKGTRFEKNTQPPILSFRKLQLGRYLIVNNIKKMNDFAFNLKGDIININISKMQLKNIINETEVIFTSGCPGCNRPFYTSKPSGPIYNFPREINIKEKEEVYKLLQDFVG